MCAFKKAESVNTASVSDSEKNMIGDKVSFAASEAYKLLRTNIQLSLPDTGKCKIVGITSSDSGDGKSTTSINLAYTIALTNKKVLLIEGDMRKPTISRRLDVEQVPGLSNYLVNEASSDQCLKKVNINENITVMPAGDIPPNPSELLASNKMRDLVQEYRDSSYDYVIVDLPPINVVTDALVISQFIDGTCIVAKSGATSKRSLKDVIRKLQFADARIIGFILTNTDVSSKTYGRKGDYYGKYYKSYASYAPQTAHSRENK